MAGFFRFINAEFFNKVVFVLQIYRRRFFLKCKIIFFKHQYFILKIKYFFFKFKYLLFQIKIFRHKRRVFLLNRKYQRLNFKYFGGNLPVLDTTSKLGSEVNNVLDSTHIDSPLTAKLSSAGLYPHLLERFVTRFVFCRPIFFSKFVENNLNALIKLMLYIICP